VNAYEYPEEDRQRYIVGIGCPATDTHLVLSEDDNPLHTTFLSVYPHLFGICTTGTDQARTYQGVVAGHKKNLAMPSLGRIGL